ncbi:hypothetical protein [Blastococcus sp. TF02-09]|uniref:hypothetical protein n=1 Tax=Blastococcus sp. TF02-09 TaxID=2250576 RepID=UPI001F1FD0EC|nr:hypothetical protein [Blastococcus sp. TF02-9]
MALTYDTTAADAAEDSDPAGPRPDRAAWARTRTDEQRRLAVQMWASPAALDSTAR